MRLSVLDLAPVPPGGTAADAYGASVELAQAAERAGYHRFWVAEHHGIGAAIAGTCPEVLITRIASATTTIRVGAGTVLLNYTRPLRVAETYRALHAMFGDRIDVGIGRAGSPPVVEAAMRPVPARPWGMDEELPSVARLVAMAAWMAHEDDVGEVLAWLDGAFADADPRSAVRVVPGVVGGPEPWLLGSSTSSAMLAGRLGMRYGFAAFFNPREAAAALRAYRACFLPGPFASGSAAPHAMLAVHACCAETDRQADRLRASVELFYASGGAADRRPLVGADEAIAELGGVPGAVDLTSAPRHLSGGPERLGELLEQLATATEADEVMIQDLIADRADRMRSYELIAGVFGLARAPAGADAAPERG